MATINDIAKFAGVSRGTVDRVLHGRANVDPLVQQKVKKAIELLDYKGRTKTTAAPRKKAAILIPKWSDAYFNRQIATGIRRAMRHIADPAFELIEQQLGTMTTQELLIEMERQTKSGIDGLIIRAENTDDMRSAMEYYSARGTALMTYDADVTDSGRICYVGQDLFQAGQIAAGIAAKLIKPTDHLLVVAGNMRLQAHKGRVDGFCTRMNALGFEPAALEIIETNEMHDLTSTMVADAMRADPRIGAIYMATEPVTGGIDGIRKAKPSSRKVHVICNDLTCTTKKYLKDGKVDFVIGQSFHQKSYRAVIAMYQYLMKGKRPSKEIFFTDTHLVTQEMLQP